MAEEKKKRVINRLKTMYPLRALVDGTYEQAVAASKAGKPVAWCMVNWWGGDAVLRAMDVAAIYPEDFGAVCAAFGTAPSYLAYSDSDGFPTYMCGYARNCLGYAARIAADNLPAPIEQITIVTLSGGMEASRFTFYRSDLERGAALRGSPEEILANGTIEAGYPGFLGSDVTVPGRYPRFGLSVSPQTRQHIGGPEQFVLYQIWLAFRFSADLGRGLSVTGIVGRDLYNNFDRIKLQSDSVLPHVRSDIKNYLQQGASNIVRLQADYMFKPATDLYARVSAGIFEEMFGGISTEVLYRPF
ncbi:MAG: YjbH domain-containing protein, partial [Chloroflexi bacterium]|nr:YjbH domain-containing protein [Chloroflexota bacterium]